MGGDFKLSFCNALVVREWDDVSKAVSSGEYTGGRDLS
jgi:hypothetical protein